MVVPCGLQVCENDGMEQSMKNRTLMSAQGPSRRPPPSRSCDDGAHACRGSTLQVSPDLRNSNDTNIDDNEHDKLNAWRKQIGIERRIVCLITEKDDSQRRCGDYGACCKEID
uniref:Uncharacterized protein n=1 Tax=Panagrellus redivivus TaxID=6233 RepID=A0A7E4UZN9_PANRE